MSEQSLMKCVEELKKIVADREQTINLKPTQLLLTPPVLQWMHENNYTEQDVVDMVEKAKKE